MSDVDAMRRAASPDGLHAHRTQSMVAVGLSSAPARAAKGYRPDIDGLRAVAVVLVILFHAGVDGFTGGYIGVDVFFVISGFLITGLIHKEIVAGEFSFVRFYERRIRRIIPALFLVIFVSVIAGWFILLPSDLSDLTNSAAATAKFISNIWFWRETENYFAHQSEYAPLLHTWSLAVEEQFYIVFPILLIALARLRRARATVIVIAGICALSFAYSAYAVAHTPSAAFFLATSRAWELGLGALLALGAVPPIRAPWLREAIAAAGLAAIVAAGIVFRHATPFPGMAALAPCLGAAAIIYTGAASGAVRRTCVGRLLSLRPVVFVGLISYSLYLWHWPMLAFLRQIFGAIRLPMSYALPAIAAAFVAAALSWALVERPFRDRARTGRTGVFTGWVAASAAIIVLAAGVSAGVLPTHKMPDTIATIAAAMDDANPRQEECFNVFPDQGLCRLGAGGDAPPSFVLWGDSHAEAAMPGMEEAAAETGRTGLFAGQGGCPPVVGFRVPSVDHVDRCLRFNDAVIAELQKRDTIKTVILTARWGAYARNKADDGGPAPPGSVSMFQRTFLQTVKAIRATGRDVVILGDVPEFEWDVPKKLIAAARWHLPIPKLDKSDALERNANAHRAFEIAARNPGVRFISLIDVMCTPNCKMTYAGKPIYRDRDHLTATASRALLGPILAKAIGHERE